MNEVLDNTQSEFEDIVCMTVDDDKISRTFIKTALYQIGLKNVKEAGNSQEAWEHLNSQKIDIILLDQQMPDINGVDFAKSVRNSSTENIKDIPIIMITVDTMEKTVLDAKSIGIHEYLVKPISPLALKKKINSALGVKQERL